MVRLAIVELRVNEWPAAVEWFRTVFDLPVLMNAEAEQYALLNAGDVKLAIKHDSTAQTGDQVLLQWEVPDLESWLKQRSVNILKPLKVSHEGYRRVIIEGPEQRPLLVYEMKQSAEK